MRLVKRLFIIGLVLLSNNFIYSQSKYIDLKRVKMEKQEFYKILDFFVANKVYFQFPEGSYPLLQNEQNDVSYDLAYTVGDEDVEYRVVYYPHDYSKRTPKEFMLIMMQVMCLNISQDKNLDPEIYELNQEVVKGVFNADFGFSTVIKGNSMFSKPFPYVQINSIHKAGNGTLFTFILTTEEARLKNLEPIIQNYFRSFYFFKYDDKPF